MELPLLNLITTDDQTLKDVIAQIPEAEPLIREAIRDERDRISNEAIQAFKAFVPVKTRELRNIDIKRRLSGNTFEIYVADLLHVNTRGKKKPTAASLAQTLNEVVQNGIKLHRRDNSIPAGPFIGPSKGASTANWIEQAIDEFQNR